MNKLLLGLSLFYYWNTMRVQQKQGLTLEQRMALLEERTGSCRKRGGKSRKNVKEF
ncbi:hypothetical protein [Escherichia coli]|uniref:hypothetical protein n=1 Tax=Escherichia coli TaxID=562 RepID=UPI003974B0EF